MKAAPFIALIVTIANLSCANADEIPSIAYGFLDPAGPVAAAQLQHFQVIVAIMMLVILPIFIAVPILIWRYRRGGKGSYRPKWEFNSGVETIIWGFPLLIVGFLAVALWGHTMRFDPYKPLGQDPMEIQVISLDWKFLFLYPDQNLATVDYLALPLDRPVTLKLTSGTVMQSFIIPQLAGQIYSMAGMQTQLNLLAEREGQLIGRNTQYNGTGFAQQSFEVSVLAEDEFKAWIASKKESPDVLTVEEYKRLLQPGLVSKPQFYNGFPSDFFQSVIASFAPSMVGQHPPHHAHNSSASLGASSHQDHHDNNPSGGEQ